MRSWFLIFLISLLSTANGQLFLKTDSLKNLPFIESKSAFPITKDWFCEFQKIGKIENSVSDFEFRIYSDAERGSLWGQKLYVLKSDCE